MPALLLLLAGCPKETTTWSQYNAADDSVVVEVGAAELVAAVSAVLHSNTGQVEIGTASVDPGGGPIGTLHTVQVDIAADYHDDVGRVSVRIDSGDRGEDEYNLTADSTGEGVWVYQLESVGEEGETRQDTFTFRLWHAESGDSGGG